MILKKLSPANWLTPDATLRGFVRLSPEGKSHSISGEEWLNEILRPSINESVPIEMRKLFEVARGTLAYGYFFYPIYTIGIEQLYRVVESAVGYKCMEMDAPKNIDSFKKEIGWLIENNIIPKNEILHWESIRELRNIASHPKSQSINMPVDALRLVVSVAQDLNFLFGNTEIKFHSISNS